MIRAWCYATILLLSLPAQAQTTAFNFQGKLSDAGNPASGDYDMQFRLFDSAQAGAGVLKGTYQLDPVTATSGVFSVTLDFGAAADVFDGSNRFLEIGVRPSGSAAAYTVLAPRTPILSSPYAMQAINAQQLGGVPASAYVTTASVGNGFVRNDTALQAGASFNIDGKGQIGSTLGIGMAPGASIALDVLGNARVSPGNGTFNIGSPNGETGLSISAGSGRVDLRFDGQAAKLVAGAAGGPPAQRDGIVVSQAGQVLIGANTLVDPYVQPNVKLVVLNPKADSAIFAKTNTGSLGAIEAYNQGTGVGLVATSNGGVAVQANGKVVVGSLGAAGSAALCINATNQIASCSSSLRYKDQLREFAAGLNVILRLNPVSFRWKNNGERDIGFGAEDVAKVDPLFVTRNAAGEIEGVKYDRLSTVFVNAVKEQQAQIERQATQLESQAARIQTQTQQIAALQDRFERQQRQLAALQSLACQAHEGAAGCQE